MRRRVHLFLACTAVICAAVQAADKPAQKLAPGAGTHVEQQKSGTGATANKAKQAERKTFGQGPSQVEAHKASGVTKVPLVAPALAVPYTFAEKLHFAVAAIELLCMLYCLLQPDTSHASSPRRSRSLFARTPQYVRCVVVLALICIVEAIAHRAVPLPHLSASVMIMIAVLFTINPVEEEGRIFGLHMGSVPPVCVLWLAAVGVLNQPDLVRSLYGTDSLRPYHLVVMFTGSVYLCTSLERSGFLHTVAAKFVAKYGRSPWGLFWALGCFSGVMTVVIPDDIVTMTMTPVTIRMCHLLNLPEIPFLFSQFFAGNIWAVTLVTGNPTNVLLAEDLGDTFLSFARRMGLPGVAAGLTSFALMYWTNRHKVNVVAERRADTALTQGLKGEEAALKSGYTSEGDSVASVGGSAGAHEFTRQGFFCLARLLAASAFCALDSLHGLPVYLCVLIIGISAFVIDVVMDMGGLGASPGFAADVLRHMPWELLSFVTAFLVLAEAMAKTGISLWLATIFMPLVSSRSVAFVSGFTTMVFCNIFETLPATLVVFKMIESVPQWQAAAIAAAGGAAGTALNDARRAALSAVIFGSNFGANTSCIGSLGGLMMRRLASQEGVTVTNGMLLKQGIPVMIPVMSVACFVLIQQEKI